MLDSGVKRFLLLGLVFVGLIITGAIVLEVLEGYQITTTEFYGIRNIGFLTYSLSLLFAYGHHVAAIYVIIVIPISWLLRKRVHSTMIRILIYICSWGVGGIWVFDQLYSEYFVVGYGLNRLTSIWIFAVIGLLYAITEHRILKSRSA
ncbi:hypothetical protein [Paenibacillus xylanilyticus]|uniref:hypothetical protein n=1 Tax=Paenibacillus xylanilyticus TaxID=248903 RepID=UPI003AAB05C3